MEANPKTINLNLVYDANLVDISPAELSGLLIIHAFQTVHREMDANTARFFRFIKRCVEKRPDYSVPQTLVLSQGDFDRIYKLVYDCKHFPPNLAYVLPVLLDELDTVKNAKES